MTVTEERARRLIATAKSVSAPPIVEARQAAEVAVIPMPYGLSSFIAAATVGDTPSGEQFDMLGARLAIRETGEHRKIEVDGNQTVFQVLVADGSIKWTVNSREEAMARLAEEMALELATDRPILEEAWQSEMAYEDKSTGDGRYIESGAIEFRNTPLPLMLQTANEGGHYGAVLAGIIEQVAKNGNTAYGRGVFDDNEAGRAFRDIIAARQRFGVSIDVAEAEGEFFCTERDEYGDCVDGEFRFSRIKIMGLTGTPFPAFEDAYIEFVSEMAADGEPCVDCGDKTTGTAGITLNVVAPSSTSQVVVTAGAGSSSGTFVTDTTAPIADLVAAAAPVAPPEAWFENPNLTRPTPLTVTPDGRVYGHIASWKSCHTSYSGRCVPPPHSRSGYAFFTTGALTTAEGTTVRVGQLTMGCGHANESPTLGHRAAKAHYDGGPGAIQMADVAVGEDEHGIWFAGALRPGVTDEQIREFAALALSGDWRQVQRGGGLELVAALSVPVPGFPIAASGAPNDLSSMPTERARFVEGEVAVLIAAGMIRPQQPWEAALAVQRDEIAALRAEVARIANIADPLRSIAAERLLASAE